jgi:hypothetical protein
LSTAAAQSPSRSESAIIRLNSGNPARFNGVEEGGMTRWVCALAKKVFGEHFSTIDLTYCQSA